MEGREGHAVVVVALTSTSVFVASSLTNRKRFCWHPSSRVAADGGVWRRLFACALKFLITSNCEAVLNWRIEEFEFWNDGFRRWSKRAQRHEELLWSLCVNRLILSALIRKSSGEICCCTINTVSLDTSLGYGLIWIFSPFADTISKSVMMLGFGQARRKAAMGLGSRTIDIFRGAFSELAQI